MSVINWQLVLAIGLAVSGPAAAQQAPASYNDMFGAWSPDGHRIAFTSDRSGDPEIYVANADGTGLLRLTNSPGRDAHPSWSSDGKSILFQSPRAGGNVQIYRMKADGTDQQRLAATSGFCGVPVESPNARHIAFQCSKALKDFGSADAPWRIYVLDRGEPEPRLISTGPGNDQVPNWSSDGRRLIFYSDRSGANQLYELNTSRGTVSQRTFEPVSHSAATYSPDGRRIAVMRANPGGKADLFVVGPKSQVVRITDSGPEFGMAVWSRDGKRLLFQMPTPEGVRLFTAPSDGKGRPEMVAFR